jgi:hypothetical protein
VKEFNQWIPEEKARLDATPTAVTVAHPTQVVEVTRACLPFYHFLFQSYPVFSFSYKKNKNIFASKFIFF